MLRKLTTLLAFAGGLLAVGAFLRRGTVRRRERVDLYYDDGSMRTLADASAESARLLELARAALAAAQAQRAA